MKTPKTRLAFQLVKQGNLYTVDPNSIIIEGTIPNWDQLHDFLFEPKDSPLPEIVHGIEDDKTYDIDMWIFPDYGDDNSWTDYEVRSVTISI